MTPGDRVHLADLYGGEPSVVEYRGQVGGYAVVVGADLMQFMVPAERVSPIPAVVEAQALPPGVPMSQKTSRNWSKVERDDLLRHLGAGWSMTASRPHWNITYQHENGRTWGARVMKCIHGQQLLYGLETALSPEGCSCGTLEFFAYLVGHARHVEMDARRSIEGAARLYRSMEDDDAEGETLPLECP